MSRRRVRRSVNFDAIERLEEHCRRGRVNKRDHEPEHRVQRELKRLHLREAVVLGVRLLVVRRADLDQVFTHSPDLKLALDRTVLRRDGDPQQEQNRE
eukprot:30756-Pelagococcus_subviridis.AAC.5